MNNHLESDEIATVKSRGPFAPTTFFGRDTAQTFNKTLAAAIVSIGLLSGCGGGGGSGEATLYYSVNASVGAGGSISPTNVTVEKNKVTSFKLAPESGFSIDNVDGCGGSLAGDTYTTAAITENCTINATFSADTSQNFSIGGTVSGLAGSNLILSNNGEDSITINSNGPFSFANQMIEGNSYAVTISSQPTDPEQLCTVTNAEGVAEQNIVDIDVSCEPLGLEKRRPESVIYLSADERHLIAAPDDSSVAPKILSATPFTNIREFKVSPDDEYVAYIADQEMSGRFELYVAEIDGDEPMKVSHLQQTHSDVNDFEWSPNSDKLAYRADDGNVSLRFSLYVVNVDGTGFFEVANLKNYPNTVSTNDAYSWSPDGHHLAWTLPNNSDANRPTSLWSIDTRTMTQAQPSNILFSMSATTMGTREMESFKWSPDSQTIAFRTDAFSNNNDQYGIAVVSGSGGSKATVANGALGNIVQIGEYHWSPDSRYLAQGVNAFPDEDMQIGINSFHVANRQSVRLVSTPTFGEIRWAHNSNKLLFLADFDEDINRPTGELALIVYDVDTKSIDDVNHDLISDEELSDDDYFWSPDDSRIAYLSDLFDTKQTYLVNSDGSDDAQLLDSPTGNTIESLSFSSDSKQLSFLSMNIGGAFHPGKWYVFDNQGNKQWESPDVFTYESSQTLKWSSDLKKIVYSETAFDGADTTDKLVSIDTDSFEATTITNNASTHVTFDYAEESLVEEEDGDD